MKQLGILILIASAFSSISACGLLGASSVTFVNNCSVPADITYSYSVSETDEDYQTTTRQYGNSLTVPAYDSKEESISGADTGTEVSVSVTITPDGHTYYHSYDFSVSISGNETITINPSDFEGYSAATSNVLSDGTVHLPPSENQ